MSILHSPLRPALRSALYPPTSGKWGGAAPDPLVTLGAIGVWYPDERQSAPRPYIPNRAASGGVPKNLLTGTRRAFTAASVSDANFFGGSAQSTLTDSAALDPNGLMEATTLVASGTGWNRNRTIIGLTAGTYTLAVSIARNGASDETFKMVGSSSTSAAKTAGAAYTRAAHTFTHAGGDCQIFLLNNGTMANLKFTDFEMYAGSSDLGPEPAPVGHMFLGKDAYNSPPYASGILDMTTGGAFGFAQFPANLDLSAGFTVVSLGRKTGTGTGYAGVVSGAAGFTTLDAALEHNGQAGFYYGGDNNFDQANYSQFWPLLSGGWHTFAHRYGSSEKSLWLDGGKFASRAGALTAPTVRDLIMSSIQAVSYGGGWSFAGGIAVFNRALTDQQILDVEAILLVRAATFGIARSPIRLLNAEGDSITAGVNQYPALFRTNASPSVFGVVSGVAGSNLTDVNARLPLVRQRKPANPVTGSKYICSIMITNGVDGSVGPATPQAYLDYLQTICDTLHSEGWLVALGTIPPRNSAQHNTNRNTINPVLRSWVGTHCDAIFDIAADATIGTDAAGSNTTYYPDGIHPTPTVQTTYFEPLYRSVINAL